MSATVGCERLAAFFDVDGTLVARPSLERRFFAELRRRHAIPARNYLLWLKEAGRLAPQGLAMIQHANKMYLQGVRVADVWQSDNGAVLCEASSQRFAINTQAFERLAWHAMEGHSIVLVTGALAPLAQRLALQTVIRLAARGITALIAVCGTRLEEVDGRWSGRIVGEAMFGEAKARAVRSLAREKGLDLARSYAYGDSMSDRWMLEIVGRPAAVNPAEDLERIARRLNWPVLTWREEKATTRTSPRAAVSRGTSGIFVGPRHLG
jgi:HAD superfamily hydrolase (TIGR01490 family)